MTAIARGRRDEHAHIKNAGLALLPQLRLGVSAASQMSVQGMSSLSSETQLPALDSPFPPGAWQQPPRESILLDETHALMSRTTFERLAEYSSTMPSGVYPGKLWRRHDGIYDRNCAPAARRWLLCWYGPVHAGQCPIEFREVLIA